MFVLGDLINGKIRFFDTLIIPYSAFANQNQEGYCSRLYTINSDDNKPIYAYVWYVSDTQIGGYITNSNYILAIYTSVK